MALSAPTLSVEVGFTANPLDSVVTWTDITPYVKNFSTARGRQHELGRTDSGTANLRLNNRDGRFDPANGSSAYSPNILPMKPIRIRATYNAITYDIWRGFTETWELIWDDVASAEVELRCSDAFKLLNLKQLNTPYVIEVLADSPKAYYRLNETSTNQAAADSSGNGYNGTYYGSPEFNQSDPITDGQDGAIKFTDLEDYVHFDPPVAPMGTSAFTIEGFLKAETNDAAFLWRQYADFDITAPNIGGGMQVYAIANANQITLATHDSPLAFSNLNVSTTIDPGTYYYVVAVREAGGTLRIYKNGTQVGTSSPVLRTLTSDQARLAARSGGSDVATFDELAVYPTALSAARIAAHYEARTGWAGDLPGTRIGRVLDAIGWPSALRNLHTGTTTLQSFPGGDSALGHSQKVAETEEGLLFVDGQGRITLFGRRHLQTSTVSTVSQITFGDGAGELPYRAESTRGIDDLDLWNEVRVTRDNGSTQVAVDAASQTSYGERTLEKSAQLMDSDSEAKDKAFYLLNQYKTPQQRLERINLHSQDSPSTLLPQMLGRELWDRVTVKHRPRTTTGYTFSQESIIERIEHRYSPGEWVTNFALSIADATQYWLAGVVGRSEAGTTTVAGY